MNLYALRSGLSEIDKSGNWSQRLLIDFYNYNFIFTYVVTATTHFHMQQVQYLPEGVDWGYDVTVVAAASVSSMHE